MAEAVGLAASCIAIIEMAAKIAGWCLKYHSDVKSAASDIDRLQRQIEGNDSRRLSKAS